MLLLLVALVVGAEVPPEIAKYVAAQEALTADDLAKARTALDDLARSPGPLQKLAAAAARAKDLEAMRAAFKPLSAAVSKEKLPAGYVVGSCPMFLDGASWVQREGKIRNPYYGSAMLECGSLEKPK
jgi:Cu(I)/Ag(I) efflux system membrane fusion protein